MVQGVREVTAPPQIHIEQECEGRGGLGSGRQVATLKFINACISSLGRRRTWADQPGEVLGQLQQEGPHVLAAGARPDPPQSPSAAQGPQTLPAQAASFPGPIEASPSSGQGWEEDYVDSLVDKIGPPQAENQ